MRVCVQADWLPTFAVTFTFTVTVTLTVTFTSTVTITVTLSVTFTATVTVTLTVTFIATVIVTVTLASAAAPAMPPLARVVVQYQRDNVPTLRIESWTHFSSNLNISMIAMAFAWAQLTNNVTQRSPGLTRNFEQDSEISRWLEPLALESNNETNFKQGIW